MGTWLRWHRICHNPASPGTAGLEPARRKGCDLEGMVRKSVYNLFTSVSSLVDSLCAGGGCSAYRRDGALQREARPWHPPQFGLDCKQASSQHMKGYRKSQCPLTNTTSTINQTQSRRCISSRLCVQHVFI